MPISYPILAQMELRDVEQTPTRSHADLEVIYNYVTMHFVISLF